jgi:DNA-binding response OmpR family regulator
VKRVAILAPVSPAVVAGELVAAGFAPVPAEDVAALEEDESPGGWSAVVVDLDRPGGTATARRIKERRTAPILGIAGKAGHEGFDACDDFVVLPAAPGEIVARLRRLLPGDAEPAEVLRFKDLTIDPGTYQASVAGVPMDLAYMEYELLRYFVTHRNRVWSREQLLANVWGYEYFGGARTVDVHVRRLRAKLGEERASWITTVRSVGYRFG